MNPSSLGNSVLLISILGVDRLDECVEMASKDVVIWEEFAESLGVLLEDEVRCSRRKRLQTEREVPSRRDPGRELLQTIEWIQRRIEQVEHR